MRKSAGRLQRLLVDNESESSVASGMRRRRFRILLDMIERSTRPVRILDIGGRPAYWDMMLGDHPLSAEIDVTLLNVERIETTRPNFRAIVGSGCAMPEFRDGEFGIVFSNSTIEHVGGFADQERMANEIRRVGRSYCVQTPNRYFPVEPHFVFPFFQFLPLASRAWLLRHFDLGWYTRIPDRRRAMEEVAAIRLLTRKEVRLLFPEATLFEERFLGMVKSFVAWRFPEE